MFSGNTRDVDSMVENCKVGPEAAVVTSVTVEPLVSLDHPSKGFERRPTE